MRKNFKRLIALTLACGIMLSTSALAVNFETMMEFTGAFEGKAVLDEDFLDQDKFSMTDAEQIIRKMVEVFKKCPNLARKLTSRKPLVIKPFELNSEKCPDAPEDSTELLSGMFRYKIDENALFIDAADTHRALLLIVDASDKYDELLNAELIALLIHTIVYDRHITEPDIRETTLPDRYFDEMKNEIIALARTKHGYTGTGNLLNGERFEVFGKEISDSTMSSKEWLLALISETLNGRTVFAPALRGATAEWLQRQ